MDIKTIEKAIYELGIQCDPADYVSISDVVKIINHICG